MRLSDFSSVLQLGVGLHLGTALLQSIAEFASAPLSKRIDRLASLAALRRLRLEKESSPLAPAAAELENNVLDVQATLELKKVQFFNEYRLAAVVNTISAGILSLMLVWAAIEADFVTGYKLAGTIVVVSFAPAILSLCTLWRRWHTNTEDVRIATGSIEKKLLG
jgi:hypothetical protein